jgi:uncharacterized protein (DUF433 family)
MIIESGKGPTIDGSRITVYDVLEETQGGLSPRQLAKEWELTVTEIEDALRYIKEHRDRVDREYAKIRTRNARGNPPEIEAKAVESRRKLMALRKQLKSRRRAQENGHARTARRP